MNHRPSQIGIHTFDIRKARSRIDRFTGTPRMENPEGTLEWIEVERVQSLPLWEGDRHFLPLPIIRPEREAIFGESGLLRALEGAFKIAEDVVATKQ